MSESVDKIIEDIETLKKEKEKLDKLIKDKLSKVKDKDKFIKQLGEDFKKYDINTENTFNKVFNKDNDLKKSTT